MCGWGWGPHVPAMGIRDIVDLQDHPVLYSASATRACLVLEEQSCPPNPQTFISTQGSQCNPCTTANCSPFAQPVAVSDASNGSPISPSREQCLGARGLLHPAWFCGASTPCSCPSFPKFPILQRWGWGKQLVFSDSDKT